MTDSCYNTTTENARAMRLTSASLVSINQRLRRIDTDVAKDSTPLFPSTKESTLCECGCGLSLSPTDSRGRPRRFIHGHFSQAARAAKRTMPRRKSTHELIGQTFGLLTVIGIGAPGFVKAQCECGNVKEVRPKELQKGQKSCGCQQYEWAKKALTKHGKAHTRIHNIWCKMRARCEKPTDPHYSYYGGRGITVCDRWESFENFYADMGEPPSTKHSIDRIDNAKGYSPDNCRWATMREQSNNRRSNVRVTARGKTLNVKQWSEITGVSASTIHARLRDGFTGEQAIAKGYIKRDGEQ